MKWISQYFNKNEEELFLNHIKKFYDFDEAVLIYKENRLFENMVNLATFSIINKDNASSSNYSSMMAQNPDGIKKLINAFEVEGDYSILKLSRQYISSSVSYYAIVFKNNTGFYIPNRYVSNEEVFGVFPRFNSMKSSFDGRVIVRHSYVFNKVLTKEIIPCYTFRIPIKHDGTIIDYRYNMNNMYDKTEFKREVEVVVAIDKKNEYTIYLLYGSVVLKKEIHSKIEDFILFLDDFLFPYNLTKEIISSIEIQLPFEFTPEFLKSINKDLKLTVDMLKI